MTNDNPPTESPSEDDSETAHTYPDHLLEQGRERGLSKTDRRYLASSGETVDNEGTDVNTRVRIRERIRESIVDFWLITNYLPEHDRDLLFRKSNNDYDNREFQTGLKNTIQFFYSALADTDLTDFDTILTSAIHDAERENYDSPVLVDVDFSVEVDEQFGVQEAYEKFERGVPLNPMEIGMLLTTGWVDDSETVEQLAHHARTHGTIERPDSPLDGEQLGDGCDEAESNETDSSEAEDHNTEHENVLRRLSADLDAPITVGDEAVYEDGGKHQISQENEKSNGDEEGYKTNGETST